MSSSTDFVLAIEDLTVSFDGFKAIDSLNLYVDKMNYASLLDQMVLVKRPCST